MGDLKINGQPVPEGLARSALEKLQKSGLEPDVFKDSNVGNADEANKLLNQVQDQIVNEDDFKKLNGAVKGKGTEPLTREEFVALAKEFEKSFPNTNRGGFVGLSVLFGTSPVSASPSPDLAKKDTWTLLLAGTKVIKDPHEDRGLGERDLTDIQKKFDKKTPDGVDKETLSRALESRIPNMTREQLAFLEFYLGFPKEWVPAIIKRVEELNKGDKSSALPKWDKPTIIAPHFHPGDPEILVAHKEKGGVRVRWHIPYQDRPELRTLSVSNKKGDDTTIRFATPQEMETLKKWEALPREPSKFR